MVTKSKSKGKPGLSKHFQNFEKGETAAIVREPSLRANFPERLQGRTGTIIGKKGKVYILELKENDKIKKFLIEPAHLKKIKYNKNLKK